jgi:WD40 repeat protein
MTRVLHGSVGVSSGRLINEQDSNELIVRQGERTGRSVHPLRVRVGPYETLREVGRGGAGVVFLARAKDGRKVALKVLLRPNDAALARFDRERRLLADLGEAQGFVPLYDAGSIPQGPYIAMPFLEGGTLRDRLRRGPLPVDEAVSIVRTIAAAMARAHERGIVHRDLKPENVLFTKDGRPLVSDLGLAKHFRDDVLGASRSASISQPGGVVGTVGYMPAEQLQDSKNVGPASDVFSLGAILYECLSGKAAFEAETWFELLGRVDHGRFEPLGKLVEVPDWLESAVTRALSRDPQRRFADAHAFELALRGGRARRRKIWMAAGALALGAGALAFALARPESPRPAPPPVATVTTAAAPRPSFPEECRGFLKSEQGSARLKGVLGDYAWHSRLPLTCVALSADGKIAVTGGLEDKVRVWEIPTGRMIATLEGTQKLLSAVAITQDGRRVAGGGDDGILRVWDVKGPPLGRTFEGHAASIFGVAFSPDGKVVATASGDKTVKLRTPDDAPPRTLPIRGGPLTCVTFSPDGKRLLTGGNDATARVWDLATGEVIHELATKQPLSAVAFAPDGRLALVGAGNGGVDLWNLETGEEFTFLGHVNEVRFVAFSADGTRAISIDDHQLGNVWNVATKGSILQTPAGPDLRLCGHALLPDAKTVLTASGTRGLFLWDLATGKTVAGGRSALRSFSCSEDGKRALLGRETGDLVALPSGKPLRSYEHHGSIEGVGLLADGRAVISGGTEVAIWGPGTQKAMVPVFEGTTGLALERGGRRAATIANGRPTIVGLGDGEGARPAEIDFQAVLLAWSPGGGSLLVGGGRGEVALVDADKNTVETFLRHKGFISGLAFLSARHAVTASWDGELVMWDFDLPEGGRKIVDGGAEKTRALAGSPACFARGSLDGTIHLHDGVSGAEVDRIDLASSGDSAESLAFSEDGRTLYVGTSRGVFLEFELGQASGR